MLSVNNFKEFFIVYCDFLSYSYFRGGGVVFFLIFRCYVAENSVVIGCDNVSVFDVSRLPFSSSKFFF